MAEKWLKRAVISLALALIAVIAAYCCQARQFNDSIRTAYTRQSGFSFPYYVKPGAEGQFTLILGDLNGLNFMSYAAVEKIAVGGYNTGLPRGFTARNDSLVIVPSIMPDKSAVKFATMTPEDFYYQIGNANGAVITDNFCTKDWKTLRDKEIYQASALSPGPFCGSEAETRELGEIIRQYNVKKVELLYDADAYKDFIKNFTDYLTERGIGYEFNNSMFQ